MKKIYYLASMTLVLLLTACDYNGSNFPDYNSAAIPTNVAAYSYSISSSDYTAIGATFTQIYTDSVTALKTQLKKATTKTDSSIINTSINRINLKLSSDSTLVAATSISTNKLFLNSAQASKLIATFLNTKYPYVDANSSAAVNFNLSSDTTKIAAVNKYTLINPTDYAAMGTATGLPGKGNFFSAAIDQNYYIPIFLKKTYSYAIKGDLKLIRYNYANATTQIATVYIYDGANWVNYNTTGQSLKTFVYRGGKWLDLLIFKEGLIKDFGTFTNVSVTGTHKWTWGTYGGVNYVKANAYNMGATETWFVSPVINLIDRANPTLSFDHAVNYIAAGMVVPDLIGAYISTDYTNDVAKATWTKLNVAYPATGITASWTAFLTSGKVSLKSYKDMKVTIGFKYVSTGAAMGWEISNINLFDE